MTARILLATAIVFSALHLSAAPHGQKDDHKSGDRTEWFKEMSKYKAEFIASELKLTDEQKKNFLLLYQEMENSSAKLAKETRMLEKEVQKKGDSATDLELEKAAEARAELKAKQGVLEKEYFAKFKKILTPKQLFNLGDAEKAFTRKLMDSHRKPKNKR